MPGAVPEAATTGMSWLFARAADGVSVLAVRRSAAGVAPPRRRRTTSSGISICRCDYSGMWRESLPGRASGYTTSGVPENPAPVAALAVTDGVTWVLAVFVLREATLALYHALQP